MRSWPDSTTSNAVKAAPVAMTACAKLAVEEDSGETSTRNVIAYPGLLLAI